MKSVLMLVFFSAIASATFAEETLWYSGSVVLTTEEVLTGEISAQPIHDLILFKKNGSIVVYPAHRIQAVYFYDAHANLNRKYVSIKSGHTVFRINHLYEVVLYGDVEVLRKQKQTALQSEEPSDKFDFDYYIKFNDQLTFLMSFRTKVYPELVRASSGQILTFIHENKLDPNLPDHAIRIIEFYNKAVRTKIFNTDLKLVQAAK